eukprot:COSAG05_NODE_6554_length_939_cov_1.075000_1_plen_245_part_10
MHIMMTACAMASLVANAACGSVPPVYCNPTAQPPEFCPGGKPCPKCGQVECACVGPKPPPPGPLPPPAMAFSCNSTVHFCKQDPGGNYTNVTSCESTCRPGLDLQDHVLAYWKFDEGLGRTTKDHGKLRYDGEHLSSDKPSDAKWVPSPIANGKYGVYFDSEDKDKMWNTSATKLPGNGAPRSFSGWAMWPDTLAGCCDGGPFIFGYGQRNPTSAPCGTCNGHSFAFQMPLLNMNFWSDHPGMSG